MSYRNPTIIQDAQGSLAKAKATKGLQDTINSQFKAYSDRLTKEFEEDKKKQLAEAKEKAKITEANQTAKNKAQDKLNKLLTESGLNDATVPSSTEAVIKQLKEMYYECSISDSDECSRKMSVIEQLPQQIAQGVEVQGSLTNTFNEMNKIAPGEPNSLDTDRVSTTNYAFGEEFANNGGRNVKCNFDPETLEIYWTLDEQVELEDGRAVPIRGAQDPTTGKYLGGKQYRINNAELIKSQLDPNNKVPFFPVNGDSAPIINIMHDGDKEQGIPGLGEGLKDNVLTYTKKNDQGQTITEEIDGNRDPKAVNEILRERVNQYSFEGTLNSSNAANLWGGSLRKNLNEVKRIKDKNPTKPEDLNSTERKLMETWYGPNWFEEGGMEDANDPMVQYENNGSAAFGPWIGGDQSAGAKDNDIVKLQRQIMSNGLILDYEKKYLLPTSDQVETKDDGTTEINIEETNVDIGDEETTIDAGGEVIVDAGPLQGRATQEGGMTSFANDKIVLYDSNNVDELQGPAENVPGLNFMVGIENTVGCMSNGKAVPCKGYGENKDQVKATINKINKQNLGKGEYTDAKGRKKKALNNPEMWGDTWDGLPEEFKTSVLQYNFNSSWDPRVVTMLASGAIDIDDRGSYHRDPKKLQEKWDEVKDTIDYANLDGNVLRSEMIDVYKHTWDSDEKWKYSQTTEPKEPAKNATKKEKDKYNAAKANYDKYYAKAEPVIEELNEIATKFRTEKDPQKREALADLYYTVSNKNNFNSADQTFLPDNYPSYEARMDMVNSRYNQLQTK